MTEPILLATKDPAQFRNQSTVITIRDNIANLQHTGDYMGFPDLMNLRTAQDPAEIRAALPSGYRVANIGISAALTVSLGCATYGILVMQERPDFKDTVAKLLSGYVPANHNTIPLNALDEEIAEEFLPLSRTATTQPDALPGKVLPGVRGNHPLRQAFENRMPYDTEHAFQLTPARALHIPAVEKFETRLYGVPLPGNPRLYIHAPTNSAQLVYSFHVHFPSVPDLERGFDRSYLDVGNVTLCHSEDKFKGGKLEVMLQRPGLLLIGLSGDRMTDKVYTFEDGALVPSKTKVTLSEAFVAHNDGIVESNNVPLEAIS